MKYDKAVRRDSKRRKNIYGMRRDGDSAKVIQRLQIKRRDKIIKKLRQTKEELSELEE